MWFLGWVLRGFALGILAIIFAYLEPTTKTQLAGPVVGGVFVYLIDLMRGLPNIVIHELGKVVEYRKQPQAEDRIELWIHGILLNDTSSGRGDLEEMALHVHLEDGKEIQILPEYGVYAGYRFEPNARFGISTLRWIHRDVSILGVLGGCRAWITVKGVGGRKRKYKVRMADYPKPTE